MFTKIFFPYFAQPLEQQLTFVSTVFLGISIILLWNKNKKFAYIALITSLALGLLSSRIEIIGMLFMAILFGLFWLSKNIELKIISIFIALATIIISLIFNRHFVPGINNWMIVSNVYISKNAIPYSMFINYDKSLVGLAIAFIFFPNLHLNIEYKKFFKILLPIILSSITVTISLALLLKFVSFDPKYSSIFIVWVIDNILFVCIPEELLFRGYILQLFEKSPCQFKFKSELCVLIIAILFGLLHWQGGYIYMILSFVAGIFYGLAFIKTRRIEGSILAHASVNICHFVGFTYPCLI